MELLTREIREQLEANWRASQASEEGCDHVPALKLFNPCGSGTWILTELADDGDTLFGLCDLGFGCPELGYVSLGELRAIKLRFGLKIERDLHFEAKWPIGAYAEASRIAGRIIERGQALDQVARSFGFDVPAEG